MEQDQTNKPLIFPRLNKYLPRRNLLLAALLLLVLSLFTSWYFKVQPNIRHQQKLLQSYVSQEEKGAQDILGDSDLMRHLISGNESLAELQRVTGESFGLFVFAETLSGQELLFWNNNRILPPHADFRLADGTYFQQLSNGYYVLVRKKVQYAGLNNRNLVAYMLIPVMNKYYVESSSSLPTRFVHDRDAIRKIAIAPGATAYPITALSGKSLLYIRPIERVAEPIADGLTITLRVTVLILLLIYLHLTAEALGAGQPFRSVVFLALCLLAIRTLLFLFPELLFMRQFDLFDPAIYATSWLNRSLGDLLINAVCCCWIVLYAWYRMGSENRIPVYLRGNALYAGAGLAMLVLILSTFLLASIVNGLVADSKISFNVTDFFSLNSFTIFGLFVLALMTLIYYYGSRLLMQFILPAFRLQSWFIYFIMAVIGLIYLTLNPSSRSVLFQLPVLIWLLVYTLILTQERSIINRFRATIAGILFWIFVFSISMAIVIMKANREKELRTRRAIAEKYEQTFDPSSNYTLSIAIKYLDNRFLLNNLPRFNDPDANRALRDSILRSSFAPGFSSMYDTRLYLFDSLNRGINNDGPMSFPELNTIYTLHSRATEIPDLYFYENAFDQFTYLARRLISDSTGQKGSLFLVSSPRRFGNSDALYAELFKQANPNDIENSPVYSYAVYNDTLLSASSSKYPFPITLTRGQIPRGEFESRVNGDNDELWYKAGQGKIIVVARKKESLLESITLFSYLFCAFLFMVGVIELFSFLVRLLRGDGRFNLLGGLSIRGQIQGTIIFTSVLLFLIIGAATISFFIARYNRTNTDKLSRTSGVMLHELKKRLADSSFITGNGEDSMSRANLHSLVSEVADVHGVNVNLYDLSGNLLVTSEDLVYTRGILSNKIHPLAYYHLNNLREVQHVQKESISSLDYLSSYATVRDARGMQKFYLNIPYFTSQLELKQEISNFLVTIINLNAFIFLIAGVIALFITNKITQSLSVIGEKMKAITLGKTNEEIVWTKNDEIGELVKQYNKMVAQLEESAVALARSEREGAWREMARQVAHEIKNPLTPMKLSIQYLQRAIDTNSEHVKELTASVANTLIEQIDHLSKIAADFSQFANITNRKIEIVDLHQTIGSLVDLYGSNARNEIEWNKLPGTLVMKADKTQMNRVFTNLLANATDACVNNERCIIKINEVKSGNTVTISISDNGEGVPEEMREKIFTPNFTTKSSGTGLGLAMCKNIIEQAQGNIWFETEVGKGTTFYVELPVVS